MSIDDEYEPPRGRSLARWAVMAVIALIVAVSMIVGALGGLGVFSPSVPTPRPTPADLTASG